MVVWSVGGGSDGGGQEPREALGPRVLSASVGDEVLPDLDLDVRKTALFTVLDDGVVGQIAGGVGFVFPDDEIAFTPERLEERPGHARVAVVEHADMPRARHVHEHGREAVHRHEDRREPHRFALVEGPSDFVVVRVKDRPRALFRGAGADVLVARNGVLSLRGTMESPRVQGPVAVDDQT